MSVETHLQRILAHLLGDVAPALRAQPAAAQAGPIDQHITGAHGGELAYPLPTPGILTPLFMVK